MTPAWIERIGLMLPHLRKACGVCGMCPLGRHSHEVRGDTIDPHVFSSMTPSKFMVVGQNPGYNECKQGAPFVGDAGENFNSEIRKHGLDRSDFYITNAVKCHTPDNRAPIPEEVEACEAFLRLEFSLLRPKLVVALGAVAYNLLCHVGGDFSNPPFGSAVGKIISSPRFGVKVFPIYHPSPRNLVISERKLRFEKDVMLLCRAVIALKASQTAPHNNAIHPSS